MNERIKDLEAALRTERDLHETFKIHSNARIAKLEEALRRIADFDIDRPVFKNWRDDKQPSKNDLCVHNVTMYDECAYCYSAFARKELE